MGSLGLIHWLILGVLCLVPVAVVVAVALIVILSTKSSKHQNRSNLDPCPDCGRMVSRSAVTCPHCGRPLQS
jgi:hypothetical protein